MKFIFDLEKIKTIKHAKDQYCLAPISKQGRNFISVLSDSEEIFKKSKTPISIQVSRSLILEILDWLYEEKTPCINHQATSDLIDELETLIMKGSDLIHFGDLPIGSFFNDGFGDVGDYVKINNDDFHNSKIIFYFEDETGNIVKTSEVLLTFNKNTLVQKTTK